MKEIFKIYFYNVLSGNEQVKVETEENQEKRNNLKQKLKTLNNFFD